MLRVLRTRSLLRPARLLVPSPNFTCCRSSSRCSGGSDLVDVAGEVAALRRELERHDQLYHSQGTPELADSEYDALRQRLRTLLSQQQTQRDEDGQLHAEELELLDDKVGASPPSDEQKFPHSYPMLSLENVFDRKGVAEFMSKLLLTSGDVLGAGAVEVMVEPKIDGISLALRYKNGQLVEAGTRGNGSVGVNVTDKVNVMKSVPHYVSLFRDKNSLSEALSLLHSDFPTGEEGLVVEVRGEVYLEREDFLSISSSCGSSSLNPVQGTPRNKAAGIFRRKGVGDAELLRFFAYSLMILPDSCHDSLRAFESEGEEMMVDQNVKVLKTQVKTLDLLRAAGFQVASNCILCPVGSDESADIFESNGIDELYKILEDMESIKSNLPYYTDGAVLKANDMRLQAALGSRSRSPRWSVAFKYAGQVAETTLIDIDIQVGRTGALTPVAILQPVNIGGVLVSRATLHNEAEVNKLKLYPGARVKLRRSGDVIPKIVELVQSDGNNAQEPFKMPDDCPVCGSKVECIAPRAARKLKETIGLNCGGDNMSSVMYRCTGGSSCDAQTIEKIRHFASKDAMNIQGLGLKTIEKLFESGHVEKIRDIFDLEKFDKELALTPGYREGSVSRLYDLKGWGPVSVQNLFSSINKSRQNVSMAPFLYGVGIRHIGNHTANLISQEFDGDFKEFLAYLNELKHGDSSIENRLLSIPGVGMSVVQELYSLACDSSRLKDLEDLSNLLQFTNYEVPDKERKIKLFPLTENPVQGKVVVFTGRLGKMTRLEAEAQIEAMGGVVKKNVSKDVDILIVAQSDATEKRVKHQVSAKERDAAKLGIAVWTEMDCIKVFDDFNSSNEPS